ncbi:universal stress protein [Haloferacaceae archaeon DSL9]
MGNLLARPLVPIASEDDAVDTYERLRGLLNGETAPVVVYVVEKAGGGIDKASVEQREDAAEKAFDAMRDRAGADGIDLRTKTYYGTDVAETIDDAAAREDATAIVFAPRESNKLFDLLTGNVRDKLVSTSSVPVVVLPSPDDE